MHIPKAKEENTMTNRYFEEMRNAAKAFEEAKAEMKNERDQILEKHGWDSEEMKAWKEREKALKFPYTNGQMKAFWAWRYTNDNEFESFTMNDFLWDKEVEDFARTMKEAGITEFVYTCTSTALMDNIHDLEAAGFKMTGLSELTKKNTWGEDEIIRGLRFEAR